jgi:hypothetical protein
MRYFRRLALFTMLFLFLNLNQSLSSILLHYQVLVQVARSIFPFCWELFLMDAPQTGEEMPALAMPIFQNDHKCTHSLFFHFWPPLPGSPDTFQINTL